MQCPPDHNSTSQAKSGWRLRQAKGLSSWKFEAPWRAGPTREKKRYNNYGHQNRDGQHVLCRHSHNCSMY
jgi:hypothetical protein